MTTHETTRLHSDWLKVVEAYDSVFYNVMDRKDSPAYLRQAVKYGVTRQRGMIPPYNPLEEIQLTVGLEGTVEDVSEMAGNDVYARPPAVVLPSA